MNKTLILLVVALILNSRVEAQWVQTNGPYEGHVPTLATMGTNVFAGTLGGEVFLTTDGGASWSPRNEGLPELEIDVLAVSGTTLFAGTHGGGVFISDDT